MFYQALSHLDSIVIITARRNDVEQNEEILITQQSIMARKKTSQTDDIRLSR